MRANSFGEVEEYIMRLRKINIVICVVLADMFDEWYVMLRELDSCSNVEIQGTVRFLCVKCLNFRSIHREINADYSEHELSHPENCLYK